MAFDLETSIITQDDLSQALSKLYIYLFLKRAHI